MLLYEQLPSLAKHLFEDLNLQLEVYSVRWFFSMFCIDLPFEYAQSVLDLYILDQVNVLIRISLAIFSLLAAPLSMTKDQEEAHSILQNISNDQSFMSMSKAAFFNLACSFDIPAEILSLLQRE